MFARVGELPRCALIHAGRILRQRSQRDAVADTCKLEFEQSLARANVAAMLKQGGYLLTNDKLPDTVSAGLRNVLETPVISSEQPLVRDVVFCYQRLE